MKKHFVLFFIPLILIGKVTLSQQAEYDRLKAKIEAEDKEPHSATFEEYIHWLRVKAADRDIASDLASKYSMEGNPYWEKRFLDLVHEAQESGEGTLWEAEAKFLELKGHKNDWHEAVRNAEIFGKRLFLTASELSFDAEYIRESVRCLMRFALGAVEKSGYLSLYENRVTHTNADLEGDGSCYPRSVFFVVSEGNQLAPVDKGLSYVDKIRDVCEWFQLIDYDDGTVLMNQFLLDFLCDDKHNNDKNLQWYLSLAKKYKLEKSENYILGFYGTLYGKVEVQEGEEVSDAPGAKVQVTDDTKYLKANADENGNYVISKAPLHCNCPPLPISAEYQGDRVDSKYQGELSEPDPESRQKKDLLIAGSGFAWTGTISLEVTQTFNCDVEEQISDLSRSRTQAADHKRTVANITLGLSDFDLPSHGTSAGAKLQYISGQLTTNMSEDHTTEGNADKTECFNKGSGKHEWVSPGNWSIRNETMAGQAYCDIEDGGLNLLIVKEMVGDKEAMDNMQQQMAEMQAKLQEALKTMDTQAMDKIKGDMLNLAQGDQSSSSIPIKVAINIIPGLKNYPVNHTFRYQVYNVCTGDLEENDSRAETREMPILVPLGAEMKGHYTRDDKGNDRIEASINDSEPYYVTFGSDICPEGLISISGSISLRRNKN